jgi:hypothetical protein
MQALTKLLTMISRSLSMPNFLTIADWSLPQQLSFRAVMRKQSFALFIGVSYLQKFHLVIPATIFIRFKVAEDHRKRVVEDS